MNDQEKKSSYEEMRRGEALQTLIASSGGKVLIDMLLNQYQDSFNQLMKGLGDKEPHLIKIQVIDKLIKDMKGDVDFGQLAKERLSDYMNKIRGN